MKDEEIKKFDVSWTMTCAMMHSVFQDIQTWADKNLEMPLSSKNPIGVYGIPRGGSVVAALLKSYPEVCLVDTPGHAHIIVDDIIDSGHTAEAFRTMYQKPVFALINKIHAIRTFNGAGWYVFPWEKGSEEQGPEENIRRILEYIGEDPNREGLQKTPRRMLKAYGEWFRGYGQSPENMLTVFEDGACEEMVIVRDIEFYSHCEHHMAPFFGKCHIGYIPAGKVVGVSKLARLLEIYSRRMQIQERIGQQVTEALEKYLQPLGCGCIIEAQHLCMTSRGVQKQNSVMVTSSMRGEFLKDDVKSEFLQMVRNG